MQTSHLFDYTMRVMWGGDEKDDIPKEAFAVASFVKTHRVNAENAFEVLAIMWPDAKMIRRNDGEGAENDPIGETWYDVQFDDGSQVMVGSMRGIGSALELVS